ncbi:uncharacterized protein LOC125944418 [Dermacentor silvarum]|uniref:uncharacterized protein LOC125944418 n=1 Tax=Dermacentor silvarum TaxID=543639 RepID=UPI00210106F3|nr:uncharacterized protein LOC125944418 [Dermacentor silvarum]
MVAVVSEAELEEALRHSREGAFRHGGQEYSVEVVETSPDTGETVKHSLQQPDVTPAAAVAPPVANAVHDLQADERPESIPASEQPSPSEAPSSPVAPTDEPSPESSPGPALVSPPLEAGSPAEAEAAAVAVTATASLATSPSPSNVSSGSNSSSSSSSSGGDRPHARKHGHHRHHPHHQRAGQAAGDGHRKRVFIDEAAVGHDGEKGKGSTKHRRRPRRRVRPPAPSVADVLVILCGFIITLAVLTGLAASTRHLFKQKSEYA